MKYGKVLMISFLMCLMVGLYAYADQYLYIDVMHYLPGDSAFGVEVEGNTWTKIDDPDAFNGDALASPGDNDYNGASTPGLPFLVYKFTAHINAGESTADGKIWIPWARMRVPASNNSFFWQVSTDKVSWMPAANDTPNRWNDDAVNDSDVWYWQDNTTGNDGGVFPDIAVGLNFLRLGTRETDPVTFPTIDVICFRNDGQTPSVDEAANFLATAVEPDEKLSTSWGQLKNTY